MTVADLLLARAQDDRPGLRSADGAWTWREVVRESAVRAAWMRSRAAGGTLHVGVLSDNIPEVLFLLGGAALSGAVLVGLNTSRSPVEIAGDAARADCDLVVVDPAHSRLATELREQILVADFERLLAPFRDAPVEAVREITTDTLLMLIFTSGTSGTPRAVRITHRKVTVPGESLAGSLVKADDVVYCPMPLFHSGAIMAAWAPALVAGAELALRRKFSASGLLPDLRAFGATYMQYVGKALSYALTAPAAADDADNPLKIAFGNEAAPLEQRAFAERFGCYVIDAYGSTETAIALTPDPTGPKGALGRLSDGIKILDPETGTECPVARYDADGRVTNLDQAIGELVNTQGLGLFDGYYNDAQADAERLRGGMFWSGDHGYADENGFVFFTGRSLDRLRVDGENFGAVQVERVLAELPGVAQLAVYGVPDEAAGDQVMLALVGDFDPAAFTAFVRGRRDLSPKWIPRYVRVAATLPSTPSNKILKRVLARDGWQAPGGDQIWWRPDRELTYRLMTSQDRDRVRLDFERRGRLNLLEGSGS